MMSRLFRLLRSLAVAWLVLVVLVAVLQNSLLYFPSRVPETQLLERASARGLAPWRDAAGQIIGWKSGTRSRTPPAHRLLVFHGNAGFAMHREYYLEGFESLDAGRAWEVFLFEYPGYGARPGKPGETSINTAAAEAFAQLLAEDARPIFLLGESLGGGPACALAGQHPQRVAGVVLVTPFARLTDVAAHHYPWLPVRLLLRDRWDNAAALAAYPGRLAVRLAETDEVIPAAHGQALFDAFTGPKRVWIEAGASHNGLDYSANHAWWRETSDFLLGDSRR